MRARSESRARREWPLTCTYERIDSCVSRRIASPIRKWMPTTGPGARASSAARTGGVGWKRRSNRGAGYRQDREGEIQGTLWGSSGELSRALGELWGAPGSSG